MENLSPKQFDLFENCFRRIRDLEEMTESSWSNLRCLPILPTVRPRNPAWTNKR